MIMIPSIDIMYELGGMNYENAKSSTIIKTLLNFKSKPTRHKNNTIHNPKISITMKTKGICIMLSFKCSMTIKIRAKALFVEVNQITA